MRIDVAWTGHEVDDARASGRTAIVIDVLRATTMIATLLHGGAREVWPVVDVEEARRLATELGEGTLLAGERGGLPPEGFHLGNSPLEATHTDLHDRRIVLTTTNGTFSVNRCRKADAVVAASLVNAGSVAEWVQAQGPAELLIVCAGTRGAFSLDDALGAGLVVSRLTDLVPGVQLTDSAFAAHSVYDLHRDRLEEVIAGCKHGRTLTDLGLRDDIAFAARVDSIDVVPVLTSPERGRFARSNGA